MGILWIFLTACIFAGMNLVTCQNGGAPNVGESTAQLIGSLLGFKPCQDESCSRRGASYVGAFVTTPEPGASTEKYVPHDAPALHCIIMRPSTVRNFEGVLEWHRDIDGLEYKILEEIVNYLYAISAFRSENCSAEVKFLDMIIFAASELKQEYMKKTHDNCVYHEVEQRRFKRKRSALVTESPQNVPEESSLKKPFPEITATKTQTEKPCPEQSEKSVTKGYEVSTPESRPTDKTTDKPCPEETSTAATKEKPTPCPKGPCVSGEAAEEIIAEEEYDQRPPLVGSLRGIPGVHYPNYSDVPITSFSCADKKYIPGFYADLETGCQVFHVCYEHRRESFLCPVGTIFNQPILACDYWYSSNCSLAPAYYEVNAKSDLDQEEEVSVVVEDLVSVIVDQDDSKAGVPESQDKVLEDIAKFLPVKAKVFEFAESKVEVAKKPEAQVVEDVASDIFDKIISTATDVVSKTKDVLKKIPETIEPKYKPMPFKPKVLPVFKVKPLAVKDPLAKAAVAVTKAKLAAAVPSVIAKAKLAAAVPAVKVAAVKASVPVVAAKAKVAVPVAAKVKLAAVAPKVVAKAVVPALKAKMISSAVPLAKAKIALKGKALKGAAVPLVKAKKMMAVPLAKTKLFGAAPILKAKVAKAAVISPLTKKALALGYMKLLKAKKLALMG